MRFTGLLILLSTLTVSYAAADSVPTYDLTSGTVTLYTSLIQTEEIFSFSGPGATLVGGSANMNPCLTFALGGSTCDPSMLLTNIGLPLPMTGSLNGGPSLLLLGGGIQMSGSPFLLPNNPSQASFSIVLPVLFSGSFTGCVTVDPVFFGCLDPNTGQINPTIAAFSVNGKGTATLTFINIGGGSLPTPIWGLSSGTYTLNPVPEPATLLLFGTGALALGTRYKRRKN